MELSNFAAVQKDGEGVLGKLLYFSIGNILINRDIFNEIGQAMDLPRATVTRISTTDAFKSATGDIYDRQVIRSSSGSKIIKVYCRDNDRSIKGILQRELVLETLGSETNRYTKLANLQIDKETGFFSYNAQCGYLPETEGMETDAFDYCEKASDLYDLHRTCVHRGQIETVLEHQLVRMQATKVSHGKIYFCPRSHMQYVDVFEHYVDELYRNNSNHNSTITVNSLYVVDDEKQREKMAGEFYGAVKKEIEVYVDKLDHLINSGCQSAAIMNRWALKVNELEGKKHNYEQILQRDFDNLNSEFSMLRLQAQELQIRARKLKQCA